jgi:uncharacterized protein YbaP (TraB family)
MRRASVFAVLFLAVASALFAPARARAETEKAVPACSGRDIFTAMKTSDPEGYAKIRAAADAVPNTGALLWRVEGKGRPASYLFGTMHSTDPRVTTLPPAVTAAFSAAKWVALEYDGREAGPASIESVFAAQGLYHEGNGLKDALTPAEMATLGTALAAEGVPENVAHVLRPWFVVFALSVPACEKQRTAAGLLPLDKRLEADAVTQGKFLVGLETVESQIAAMAALPEDVQLALLRATVATVALRDDALEAMHQAYLRHDIAIAVPLSRRLAERAGHDPAALDVFERDLGVKRNYAMREGALPLLQQGAAFIAVGAMHLVGREGLVELVRSAGYTVTPVE